MDSFAPSPSLEHPAASPSVNDEDDADSFDDDKISTSQWLALCYPWQIGGVVLVLRVVLYLGGELV